MGVVKHYSVLDLSIPVVDRNVNGIYHLKTDGGYKSYRVLNNSSKDFVPIDAGEIFKLSQRESIYDLINPSVYMYNEEYSEGINTEFKRISVLDDLGEIFTKGTFCNVTTWAIWSDSNGMPVQIATEGYTGKRAKRYGTSTMSWSRWSLIDKDIIEITLSNLTSLKLSNNLQKGARYFITDRDIWIDALDTNKLSMECERHFRIVKDEHYTPDLSGPNMFLGIYGQTYDRGSVPNSHPSNLFRYYAIWGGRMWRRNNSGTDVPGTSDASIAGGWTLQPTTNNTFYESKIFNIKYDFDEDRIWEQSDDRGNVIRRVTTSHGTSNIDITDWGNTKIYNNQCSGIYNNFNNNGIYDNSNIGYIYRNSNTGYITNNSNKGHIFHNTNTGYITNNSNSGYIQNNSNSNIGNNSNNGNINENSNNGNIVNNSNNGNIVNNSNSGHISTNSNNGYIQTNSNNGYIQINSNNGNINNNLINGNINNNSNIGNINNNLNNFGETNIRFNTNNGYIGRNRMNGTLLLEYNNNNGHIGSTSTISRNADITDNIVNK